MLARRGAGRRWCARPASRLESLFLAGYLLSLALIWAGARAHRHAGLRAAAGRSRRSARRLRCATASRAPAPTPSSPTSTRACWPSASALLAVAAVLRRRSWLAVGLVAVGGARARHHGALVCRAAGRGARRSSIRGWRTLAVARGAAWPLSLALWALVDRAAARPPRHRWTTCGCRRWRARTRSSRPQWPVVGVGGQPRARSAVLWWAHRRRVARRRRERRGRGARVGRDGARRRCSSSRCPLVAAGVALPVQLQISRVFWLVDFVALIYVVASWRRERPAGHDGARAGRRRRSC